MAKLLSKMLRGVGVPRNDLRPASIASQSTVPIWRFIPLQQALRHEQSTVVVVLVQGDADLKTSKRAYLEILHDAATFLLLGPNWLRTVPIMLRILTVRVTRVRA